MPREGVALHFGGNLDGIERLATPYTEAGFVHPDLVGKLPLDGFRVTDDFRRRFGVDFSLPFPAPLEQIDGRLCGIPGIQYHPHPAGFHVVFWHR
jgi:hypothetical protein